ncbi:MULTISPECIES: hypothetical protein [Mycobacterium]|uniref:Uncharacterized protein n=2 Tax=Mycobacterium TaxID=1763 RepID=A0A1X1XGD4_9MYCO|nr:MULTISPECIES: hypothetical protein [Mycobacterium]MCV6992826.1 hypothetical protein [Mycobacterium bouchedurhonense]MCV6993309.1 hypothetical protein [Mycobacterium timonense]ORV97803.1 hypothetical protein AWC14_14680 [Mycobacterium kyorinense]
MTVEASTHRTTVEFWHPSYNEPCEHGPLRPDDACCAEHRILVTPAGRSGWPTDLNDLGYLRMRAYTATNWFDVLEVLDWRGKHDPMRLSRRGVEYTLVIDNGGQPLTITTDTIAFVDA